MTVCELIEKLKVYPPWYEVLIELKGQEDIFTTFDLVFSGRYRAFLEEPFDGNVGEIVDHKNRNCVGFMRRKEIKNERR